MRTKISLECDPYETKVTRNIYVVDNGNVWCSCRKGTEVVVKLWINLVTNKLQTTIITIIILRGFIYLCVIYLEQNYQFIIVCKFILINSIGQTIFFRYIFKLLEDIFMLNLAEV